MPLVPTRSLVAVVVSLAGTALAQSSAPIVLSHSGYLLDAEDAPLDSGAGTTPFTFALYSSASGGSPAWSGSCALPVRAGYYATRLGDSCGSGLTVGLVPIGGATWLEVSVDGAALLPRVRLDAAPNATTSTNALALEGKTLADLDGRYAKVATGASPAIGEHLAWNGSAWEPGPDANSGGTVTNVTATAPLAVATGNTTPALSLPAATTSVDGYLKHQDWAAFDAKVSTTDARLTDARAPSGAAGGDLTDTYPNPKVAQLQGRAVSGALPTTNDVLKWNGSTWAPAADATGTSTQWTSGSGGALTYTGGNVGIGTATPLAQSKLTVTSSISANGSDGNFAAGGQRAFLDMDYGTSPPTARVGGVGGGLAGTALGLYVGTGLEAVKISATGNVGLGSNAPTHVLDVVTPSGSESAAQLKSTGNVHVNLVSGASLHQFTRYYENATGRWEVGNASADGNKFYFNPNVGASTSGAALVIQPNGNVGIGTLSPATALHLGGDKYMTFGPNSSWGAKLIVGGNGRPTTDASVAATDGNLHLDALNGGHGIYLNWYASGTAGVYVGNGTSSGYGTIRAATFTVASSARWKEHVVPLTGALGLIDRLEPVRYDWKDRKTDRLHDVGFIAEDVGRVLPEVVDYEADGVNAHGLDYARLSAVAIGGVKELRAQIREETLSRDDEIRALTRRLKALETELASLKAPKQKGVR